jgi:hypothetical protein
MIRVSNCHREVECPVQGNVHCQKKSVSICPLLTSEQLAEFCPVNFNTMEERTKAMKEAGILDTEKDKQDIDLKIAVNK